MSGAPPAPIPRKRHWGCILFSIPIAALLCYALFLFTAYHFSYSTGNRVGFIQKFSKRGWIFNTWEGELAMVNFPGSTAEIFAFTVRDADVAAAVNDDLGKRVAVTYEQHKGLPRIFGDTEYFVIKVKKVDE